MTSSVPAPLVGGLQTVSAPPYDVIDDAQRAALMRSSPYNVVEIDLPQDAGDPYAHVPEASRRARAFPVWAAIRQLGREGIGSMIESCADRAGEMAELFGAAPGVRVLNEVVLNQVLVRFDVDTDQAGDELTRRVIARVQQDGVAWFGGTVWHGVTAMRVSVSNHRTTSDDARLSVEAVLSALAQERAGHRVAPTHA